jgi:hypothetical protein
MKATFRRYTNPAATIHLLRQKKITLLNPATWDDKNDAYFMAEYKRLKSAQNGSGLVLCRERGNLPPLARPFGWRGRHVHRVPQGQNTIDF